MTATQKERRSVFLPAGKPVSHADSARPRGVREALAVGVLVLLAGLTQASSNVVSLDGPGWLLATDPKNAGREQQWFRKPRPEARPTHVPWVIQDVFPEYHGVAWYWRTFQAPVNGDPSGRCLVRFWAVDYLAEVWLNGVRLGGHEGGETPFTLDATAAVKAGQDNLLAVRVLNPTNDPIDGLTLAQTPHRNKVFPVTPGCAYDHGGIVDSVEVLLVPAVYVEDLCLRPDVKTGVVRVTLSVRNAGSDRISRHVELSAAPAAGGQTLATTALDRDFPPGVTEVAAEIALDRPRLWQLNDPFLYRITARLRGTEAAATHEQSDRCGFRDFRFENGYFRLNGRRIYLRCSHTGNSIPAGFQVAYDPDLLRRDLLNVKVMGFNSIRFIAGLATPSQLDLCDEIGLMVYEESNAAWELGDSKQMAERYDSSVLEMVRRDRNHASLVVWGLLNETADGPVFRHAVAALPTVRAADKTRVILLNSGRFDRAGPGIGDISNPGSNEWQDLLDDVHPYQRVPHVKAVIDQLRTLGHGGKPVFISEYGVGSAVDLVRVVRQFEQLGKASAEDARYYRAQRDAFLADWQRWHMEETFGRPEDYFAQCLRKMAGQRALGLNAIRANPSVVGHSLTGTVDQGFSGEGLTTTFRELKPGTVDALFDAWAPLRLCLFAEPVSIYRGRPVHLEAVLANEDVLKPGAYPLRLQVFGPDAARVLDRVVTVQVPSPVPGQAEPPFAMPVFSESVRVDGPEGRYRFVAAFEKEAAAAGGETEFYVTDAARMPPVEGEVLLWGEDADLSRWLAGHGIHSRPFDAGKQTGREVILAGARPAPGGAAAFTALVRHVARGSTVVFLSPEVFRRNDKDREGWLPLHNKGALRTEGSWLYLKDEWARRHPIFDGLPCGGLLDLTFYRDLIPDLIWSNLDPPAEVVAAAQNTSLGYRSGLLVSVHDLAGGRFILNTLRIRETLGTDPTAERLLRNLLRYAGRDAGKPLADLPANFKGLLKSIGYGD